MSCTQQTLCKLTRTCV